MLNRAQIDSLKIWLLQRQAEINSSVLNTNSGLLDLNQRSAEQFDQASLETSGRLNIRIKDRESRLIPKIELALAKIENGTFGICEECGKEISKERLMARPVTTLCIHCKQNQEAKENN
jgi:DnaK suppressor protein